jgi:hypothetical protein
MPIKRVHCKKETFDIYIGRACYGFPQSKWGNPFIIGKDGSRDEVIEKYRKYILERPDLIGSLKDLEGKILGCWCPKNKKCHGDVLIELSKSVHKKSVESYKLF